VTTIQPNAREAGNYLPTLAVQRQEDSWNMCLRSRCLQKASFFLGLLCLLAGSAWAHAIIVESTPKVNQVVTGPALEIKLRFNVRIDSVRSKMSLMLPDGSRRAVDIARQPSPDSLSATISKLVPGNYQLHWQVLANDGHITQGNIPFRVAGQ
jgi:methionine-rich copper-binding protein CopC